MREKNQESATEQDAQRILDCKLTAEEIGAYSRQLADVIKEKEDREDELESFRTAVKGKISSAEATIKILAEKVRSGREQRLVDCVLRFNFAEGRKDLIRKDTGEVVFSDPITEEERQLKLA